MSTSCQIKSSEVLLLLNRSGRVLALSYMYVCVSKSINVSVDEPAKLKVVERLRHEFEHERRLTSLSVIFSEFYCSLVDGPRIYA